MNNKNQEQNIPVKADDGTLKGAYANFVRIMHTGEEFVLDFINALPPSGTLSARVIISPQHAKRFSGALLGLLPNDILSEI